MEQLSFEIKRDEEVDLWDFDNFNWLTGSAENMRIFFTKAIPRLEKMIAEDPQIKRYVKLKADCVRRLKLIKEE